MRTIAKWFAIVPLRDIFHIVEELMSEKNSANHKIFTFLFLGIETILYGIFIWIDLFLPGFLKHSIWIKYFGIVFCFLYVLITYWCIKYKVKNEGNGKEFSRTREIQDSMLMIAIFAGTLFADWCILLHDYYVLGVVFFAIVQLLYLYRISLLMKVYFGSNLIVFIIIVITFRLLGNKIDTLFLIAAFYGGGIAGNGLRGILYLKNHGGKHKAETFFFLGLLLFLLCDINVAIYNVERYITVNHEIFNYLYGFAKDFMWIFYLPSQVLISLSVPVSAKDRKEVHTYGA